MGDLVDQISHRMPYRAATPAELVGLVPLYPSQIAHVENVGVFLYNTTTEQWVTFDSAALAALLEVEVDSLANAIANGLNLVVADVEALAARTTAATVGYSVIDVTSANQALAIDADGTGESDLPALAFTTALGTDFAVFVPPSARQRVMMNASAHVMTVHCSTVAGNVVPAGIGAIVPSGFCCHILSDGTHCYIVAPPFSASNAAGHLVVRDASGNFSAGTITATLNGVANNVSGIVAVANGGTGANGVVDAKDNLRTGRLEPNVKTASYTLQATDVGDLIPISAGDITVPPGVFSQGDTIVIFNSSGATGRNILRGSGVVMYWVGGANANRVLGVTGLATIVCVGANTFVISGQGLT